MLESAIPAIERLESLIAATNTAQMSALHNVFPKLGESACHGSGGTK